jgi:EAL domain-containing protein (putative c-di-GMP-specific phosphodiesterase class I)
MVRPGFCDHVELTLKEFGLPGSLLQLEITESLLMTQQERAIPVLRRLRQLGCRVLIDDFGTGYSSIGSLQQLPVDGLKIDQIFVQGMDVDEEKATITRVMLALSSALGLEVIAEGVESESQLALLNRHGCGGFQGYLVSPPVSAQEIELLLGGAAPVGDRRARSLMPG